ncbi:hypothetical protein FIBSPDRAFT_532572 [Athelia psychrophila]|uniref:F-box domain-containing protein n=1 Tax=Athelia psychrophila TaxID=1759441 RepID=A0A166J9Q2_9AGAM|nr:hypothetical protein FIBSPDRAFT_532572 [Fibularhizoctonia sp. CBS 109695]
MDRTPSEVCTRIYTYACTDSGFTGRSISLTSRQFHQECRPVRYQSIAVHGPQSIFALESSLKNVPAHLRRVRYLFISSESRPGSSLASRRPEWQHPTMDSEQVFLIPEEVESTASIRARLIAARAGAPVRPPRAVPQASSEETLTRSIQTIVALVAETVEVMELNIPISMCTYLRSDASFPQLTDLSSTIFMLSYYQTNPPTYPQLRRWHITDCLQPLPDCDLYRTLTESTPSLTHLRLSRIQYDPLFGKALAVALGQAPLSASRPVDMSRIQKVPPSLEKLYIQPASNGYHSVFKRDMEELAARGSDRFVLLQEIPIGDQATRDPVADWEAAIYGEEGCWRRQDGNSAV